MAGRAKDRAESKGMPIPSEGVFGCVFPRGFNPVCRACLAVVHFRNVVCTHRQAFPEAKHFVVKSGKDGFSRSAACRNMPAEGERGIGRLKGYEGQAGFCRAVSIML